MSIIHTIKQSTAAANAFNLDGLDYPKSSYDIVYTDREILPNNTIDQSKLKVGIYNKYTKSVLVTPKHYSEYSADGITPIASWDALMALLSPLLNFSTASGGSGAISQTSSTYSTLTAGESVGDLAYVQESQGTKWLPFTIGGTYYPQGFYQWTGSAWVADRNGIAEALWQNDSRAKDAVVVVKTASQLAGTLDPLKVYFVDGLVDMGSTQIKVPEGGLTIEGHGYDISKLYSTVNNHELFVTDPAGTYSGNFTMTGITCWVSGTASKIFNLDNGGNFGALELNTVNLGDFPVVTPSIGTIANYRQFRTGNIAFIRYAEGITFHGAFSGIAINDAIALSVIEGSTLFKEGTSFSVSDGMSSNMNALSLVGTSVWCDFTDPAFLNGSYLTLTNFRTRANNPIPNITNNSVNSFWKSCVGIDNTFVGASWALTTEAQTNVTANNTLFKLAGTTTPSLDAWFTHPLNNRLQYNGKRSVKVDIMGFFVLGSSNSESFVVEARQWDSSASAWINLRSVPVETALKLLGNRSGNGSIVTQALLDAGDYVELWIKDVSATGQADPTLLLQSTITISERQ